VNPRSKVRKEGGRCVQTTGGLWSVVTGTLKVKVARSESGRGSADDGNTKQNLGTVAD